MALAREEEKRAKEQRDIALGQEIAAKRVRHDAEGETALLRHQLAAVKREKSDITASVTALRDERNALEGELAAARSEKQELEAKREQLSRDYQIQSDALERAQRSRTIVSDLLEGRISVLIETDILRIDAGPAEPDRKPEKISKAEVEPWLEPVVNQYHQLLAAKGVADEIGKSLKETRAALAERYPDMAEDLRNEQATETKALNEQLLRHHRGIGGVEM